MRSQCARLFVNILVLFALTAVSSAQKSASLLLKIVDANGDPIAGAEVGLAPAGKPQNTATLSDSSGKAYFSSLHIGVHRFTVHARTFARKSIEIFLSGKTDVTVLLEPETLAAQVAVTSNYLAGELTDLVLLPGSIDTIDKESLRQSRAFNFSEALRTIAGVNVRDEEGFGLRPNIGIRGTNPTRSTKVLLLEDGVPLAYAPYGDNASYYHPPIERYDSIEVLKGSGQIAYGPQTIAGLINYITPDPTERPTFGLRLIGGNRSYFNGSAFGSGTLAKTGIYASYARKQGNGSREHTSSKLNDALVKVTRTLNGRNALTFKASYYGEDSNVTYSGLTEAEFADRPRGNPFRNDFFFGDRFGFSAAHAGVISPNTVINTVFYANRFSRDWWRQSSNSGQRPNRLNVDPDCLSMSDLNTTCGIEGRLREYETYGLEPKFTMNYTAGSKFRGELQTGFRVHREVQKRRQENGDLPSSRSGVPVEINYRSNLAYSGFAQNRFQFGDLAVTPGIRYERIRIERRNLLVSPIAIGKTVVDVVIPGIGIAYSGVPRTTVFGGVHRGFSPPRAEDAISNIGGVVELDAEKSWNYEFGLRSEPFRGGRISSTFFRSDYENQIVPASIAGGIGASLTNGGRTLQQGIEFTGRIDLGTLFESSHNVYLRTAATWLPVAQFRGTRFSSVDPTVSITGNRLPYVPRRTVTSSLGYSHQKGFDAFVENVYIGRQFGDDLNTSLPATNGQRGVIRPQNYFNATVNQRVEKWKTTFFFTVKNIFDRIFIVDRVRGILPSSPRLLQAGIDVRF